VMCREGAQRTSIKHREVAKTSGISKNDQKQQNTEERKKRAEWGEQGPGAKAWAGGVARKKNNQGRPGKAGRKTSGGMSWKKRRKNRQKRRPKRVLTSQKAPMHKRAPQWRGTVF